MSQRTYSNQQLLDDIASIAEDGHAGFFTPHVEATKGRRRPELRRQITAQFDFNTKTGKISYGLDLKSQNAKISEEIYDLIEVNYNQGKISKKLYDALSVIVSRSQKGSKQFPGGKYEKSSMQSVFDYVKIRVATGDSAAATAYVHTHRFFTPTEGLPEHAPKTIEPGC